MKCLTLWRPWGTWVRMRWKIIETRLHDRFKGLVGERIGIHNAQFYDDAAMEAATSFMSWDQRREHQMTPSVPGTIECTVLVAEARWLTGADSATALIECDPAKSEQPRFGLVLADVQDWPDKTVYSGGRGIWELPGTKAPSPQGELL